LFWTFYTFDVHGSVHRKCIFKYNQQDVTLHNVFIVVECCTCFGRVLRPLSGAQNCIHSIGHLPGLTATCRCCGRVGRVPILLVILENKKYNFIHCADLVKYSEIYTSTKHKICTITITTSWIWCPVHIALHGIAFQKTCMFLLDMIWCPVLWYCTTWHHIP
jgi:hypothetical protein